MNFTYLTDEELLRHARITADPSMALPLVAELLRRFETLLDEHDGDLMQACLEQEFTAQNIQDIADAIGGEDIAEACALLSSCNDNDVPMPDAATLVKAFTYSDFLSGDVAKIFKLLADHCVTTPAALAEILEIFDLV